ncbi:hypothetical protein [Sphingobium subterraneum]|uniref:Uncharacterized protein n=1 Tax=Sphingobium subterraneum TaxID=627688 RepID=A0A841IYK7_9SPHN|nr:hypothetical protein [Sphingobium subterraneum]
MHTRFIEWIWHITGSLALTPEQASKAFDRLAPLFHQPGTSHETSGDTLTFHKKDPASQDKMSVFNSGVLRIENAQDGPVLRYRLVSRALLYCFLAPLMFLAFAQVTVAIGKLEGASKDAAAEKPKEKDVVLPQNPIDRFLGAPAPEKPKKKKGDDEDKKPSPTASYVFAALFAALYVAGRLLEDWLAKRLFRKSLSEA